MKKSWWNFSHLLTIALLCFCCLEGYAENETSGYKKRINRYRDLWTSLMPTYSKLQYAGGMGLMNLGLGWSYGKNQQWETDVFLGFIPRNSSDNSKITLTMKQNFIPWRKELNKNLTLEPLECGIYFNTVFSDEFWTQEPDRYPKGYYGFSTRVRTHISSDKGFVSLSPTRNGSSHEVLRLSMKSVHATFM